jgi:hypothetical protein
MDFATFLSMNKSYNLNDLDQMSREEILDLRLNQIRFDSKDGQATKLINKLYSEIKMKGLNFRPHIWISDDWFCPDDVPGFALPFYLFHPKLRALEKEFTGELEGSTEREMMKLLRHETGHALENAFKLKENIKRTQVFGDSSSPYPYEYAPKLYSKKFVRHLGDGYAQAHPDEDFAETFAVWLTPQSKWRQKYLGWNALYKLQSLHQMMKELKGKKALVKNSVEIDSFKDLNIKLKTYFKKRSKRNKLYSHGVFHHELPRLFERKEKESASAVQFLRSERKEIVRSVAKRTNLPQYKINILYKEITKICFMEKGLRLKQNPIITKDQLILILCKKSSNMIQTGLHRIVM